MARGKKKYNWEELKGEFIRGDILSVSEFLKKKKIKRTGKVSEMTKGWAEEKQAYDEATQQQANEEAQKQVVETEAQIRARQQKAAKFLQFKALNALKEQVPENAMESLRMLQVGLNEERDALDLNKKPLIAGDVNIAVMHTRYGKMLQNLDYDELKDVLTRLGELDDGGTGATKASRSLPDSVVEGEVVQE